MLPSSGTIQSLEVELGGLDGLLHPKATDRPAGIAWTLGANDLVTRRPRYGFGRQTQDGDARRVGPGDTVTHVLTQPYLGIDIGGVLAPMAGPDSEGFFGPAWLDTPVVPDALDVIARLNTDLFEGRIALVSKASKMIANRARNWLYNIDFFTRTGVDPTNVYFVEERPDKAPVCQSLGITHFIDDRLDVLLHLTSVDHRYLFTGANDSIAPPTIPEGTVQIVTSWLDVHAAMLGK